MKKIIRKLFAPIALLSLALGVSLMHEKEVVGTKAAVVLYNSFNFLDGGTSNNSAYASTDIDTNVSYASDNPGGTTGTTEWQADYANLSLTNATRLGGKLVSNVQTDDSTAWANIKTKFTFPVAIGQVEIIGVATFGTAGNTTALYLQSSADMTTWTTVASTTNKTGTITFANLTIPSGSHIRFGIDLKASSTRSGIAFTGIKVYEEASSRSLTSISASGTLTKTNYYVGDSFDPTGLTITAYFDDGSDSDVTADTTYTPDPLTLGLTSVTASYTFNGETKTTTISGLTVTNVPTLEIIVISGTMTKTDYVTTDSWDPDGLIVTAVYSDDSEVVVTDDVTWSYNPAAPNSTTITSVDVTATYGGETDYKTVSVTVSEKVSTVVISEVYGGGGNSGAAYKNDFVELYNNTNTSINISGWSVQYASATGSFNNRTTFPDNTIILPYNYFLVRWAAGTGTAPELPTPDVDSTNVNAGATNLKVALTNNDTAPSGPTDSNVVDYVGAGNANDYEGAAATGAANATSISRTKSGNIYVDTDNNSNDFSVTTPTPFNSALGIADKIMAEDTDMQCVTKFPEMKALVVQLSEGQLEYFQSTGDETLMVNARARYLAWAAYLGDNDAYGNGTGSTARSTTTNSSSNNVAAIALIGVIGITSLVGYYFINKKRLTA
jgi:hypothetical protein